MGTHFSSLTSRRREVADAPNPTSPENGDFFYDTTNERIAIWAGDQWHYIQFSTTTSTSSSTTSTSSSTTSTSSSTSRSTSTSISTSTSTTTTL